MRLPLAIISAMLLVVGAAKAQQPNVVTPDGSDNGDSVIAVPPAPPILGTPAPPIIAPPAPATAAVPVAPPPPGLVPVSPPADADLDNGQEGPAPANPAPDDTAAQTQAPAPDIAPTPANDWVPGKTAEIGVLNKVDGETTLLSVPVGAESSIGDLQINVLACVMRPPQAVPDAAVFLALQASADPTAPPNYRGWLVRSAPGAAVAGDASETFRIVGCS